MGNNIGKNERKNINQNTQPFNENSDDQSSVISSLGRDLGDLGKEILWIDPNVNNKENKNYIKQLKDNKYKVSVCTTVEESYHKLKNYFPKNKWYGRDICNDYLFLVEILPKNF